MRKTNPHNLHPDWSVIPERKPWEHITSAELAQVLGVHLQTINNWKIRGVLPSPSERNRKLKGNKNYFRISAIRSWLEQRHEDDYIRDAILEETGEESLCDAKIAWLLSALYKVQWNFA